MSKNPHFRVLALSATPGGTPEAVQEVIDRLHISRIEIRTENSLDIRDYNQVTVRGVPSQLYARPLKFRGLRRMFNSISFR
jgi:ERCC4-related helicase